MLASASKFVHVQKENVSSAFDGGSILLDDRDSIHFSSQSSSFLVALKGLNAGFLKCIWCDSSASTLSFWSIRKK